MKPRHDIVKRAARIMRERQEESPESCIILAKHALYDETGYLSYVGRLSDEGMEKLKFKVIDVAVHGDEEMPHIYEKAN